MNQDSSTPRFAPVRPEALEMNEAEKRFLAAEEARLGQKLEELSKTPTYNMCFACGEANPIGLHLHFFLIPDGCMAFFTPLPEHQSYNGFCKEGTPAYTARIDLRFRKPVRIGSTIKCVGREIKRKGRLVIMEGKIFNEDGTIAAEAESHMMLEKDATK